MSALFSIINFPRKVKSYKKRRLVQNNYRQLFRFDEENVKWIAEYFLGDKVDLRGGGLSPKTKMEIFLRYMADPGFQLSAAEVIGVDRTTACKTIKFVQEKILEKAEHWIRFPQTEAEIQEAKASWLQKYEFPDCIGAIDCTHVRILKPSATRKGDEYINRKNFASINVQATCDSSEKFTSVCSKWPGSVHDSRAPWLITPIKNPISAADRYFNKMYAKDRVIIERVFGQLKSRFPMVKNQLRIKLERVPGFIIVAFVLHNVAKHLQDPDFNEEELHSQQDGDEDEFETNDSGASRLRSQGLAKRARIAQHLFINRRF